jgi:hypothetical protein
MRLFLRRSLMAFVLLQWCWMAMTLWVEATGPAVWKEVGQRSAARQALLVFDPDPFYDLDDQVCHAFAEGLATDSIHSDIVTVAAADITRAASYDLYVFCANTYNWRPDDAVVGFIERCERLNGRPVFAITLGAGSTAASQRTLENLLLQKGARIVGSSAHWLWRPNDEGRLQESNVDVAVDQVRQEAMAIARQI